MLVNSFGPRAITPVYARFIEAVRGIDGSSIITTNVDETLERAIPGFDVIQRSDLSRVGDLLSAGGRFIAKIHGSVSSVCSMVFSSQDYSALGRDAGFRSSIKYLLDACSVVFIGYSVRDKYLLELLSESAAVRELFGDGPHFLVSAGPRPELPASLNVIEYDCDFHTDHRSAILALELVARPRAEVDCFDHRPATPQEQAVVSAHLLGDFYTAGSWAPEDVASVTPVDGGQRGLLIAGPAWHPGETSTISTAAYDLAMGLMCFDRVLVPLACVARVFELIGETRFSGLLDDDVLSFVHWEGIDSVLVSAEDLGFGQLLTGKVNSGDPGELIRKWLSPSPGRETQGKALIAKLEKRTVVVDLAGGRNFADVCNGLFVSPATRKLLGISEFTPPGRIPRWLAHPVLRVVQVARMGATCQRHGFASMKVMTGATKIATVAMSALAGGVLDSAPAGYVITGEYGIVPQSEFSAQPGLWDSVIQFRDSNAGLTLRQEILRRLMKNEGAEITPSVNASLRSAIPQAVLNRARKEMSTLLVANGVRAVAAMWSDSILLEGGLDVWRKITKQRLKSFLAAQRLTLYDQCPCGSCEKVKFCCLQALEY